MSALWGLLKGGLAGAWGYIAAGAGALLAVLVVLFQAKKAGKNEVIVETQEKEIENVQKANEVEREVAVSKPDARRERLRDKWTRD
jgi:hypothetical protein